ncbi:MAG: glutamate-5-semialdehyde dehydrogenase [Flavisolibacter sp.]|nr:glutamate-5-semialdehyde dehydrogenase [Flavisolibacter sp.]
MNDIDQVFQKTFTASKKLLRFSDEAIRDVLYAIADEVEADMPSILKANAKDVKKMDASDPMVDRLELNEQRLKSIANAIRKIAELPSPVGQLILKRKLKKGLELKKMTVPFGVVGVIYESRPNVTFDTAVLCLKSKNACLLKGSRHADETNKKSVQLIQKVLKKKGFPADCVSLLPSDRKTLDKMFTATKYIDLIIPRGSQQLIETVRKNSLVPVIETGAGVCHVYVHEEANIKKALQIVENAKTSRPSVCNAMDTLLVDKGIASQFLPLLKESFLKHKVEIYADAKSSSLLKSYPYLVKASEDDFGKEFLSLKCSVKVVNNFDGAIDHIQKYSTKHSEAIVSENKEACERFMNEVDAAVVYANASTRFTDGEEFGLGAEIGISTQKPHARGPFALEKLVCEKWFVTGNGHIR